MQFQNKQILKAHMDSQNSSQPKLLEGDTFSFIIYFISHHVSDIRWLFLEISKNESLEIPKFWQLKFWEAVIPSKCIQLGWKKLYLVAHEHILLTSYQDFQIDIIWFLESSFIIGESWIFYFHHDYSNNHFSS